MRFEPVTSAIPVRCSTNWAMKPHIGSEANLLSSYLPWGVKWCEVYIFTLLLSNCLNWKIYCDDHSSLWSTTAIQIYELFHVYFTSRIHKACKQWSTIRPKMAVANKTPGLPKNQWNNKPYSVLECCLSTNWIRYIE